MFILYKLFIKNIIQIPSVRVSNIAYFSFYSLKKTKLKKKIIINSKIPQLLIYTMQFP